MSWMDWAFGRGGGSGTSSSSRDKAKDTIINLRSHLLMLEKKEEHLNKKIEEETYKAKTNATTNKRVALNALRQKKLYESDLDKIAGRRLTIETQVNAIESANMNLETMMAMKQGAEVLKKIHGSITIDKVDATMEGIREQMELGNEISEAISNPVGIGHEVDEDALKAELDELEQEQLDEKLAGAHSVPVHSPGRVDPVRAPASRTRVEEEEDEELRQLQAELAM